MSENNMPKLPTPWLPGVRKGGVLSEDAYTADQMHAYARQYAEQRANEVMAAYTQICKEIRHEGRHPPRLRKGGSHG